MHTLSIDTNELIGDIETKLKHAYVEKFIQKPFIDIDKLFILDYIYKDVEIPETQKKRYITTIMLVQIALDIHELIPIQNKTNLDETKKQLSVLAGDYYSGLYYLLLSEMEDFKMIRTLATAIQLINEQKMKLFYDDVKSIEELIETMTEIESSLFTKVGLSLEHDPLLISIIQKMLLINRLYKEKELVEKQKFSYINNYVRNKIPNSNYDTVISLIVTEIENSKHRLDELLVHLPYQLLLLKNTIRNKYNLSFNKSVAEEG